MDLPQQENQVPLIPLFTARRAKSQPRAPVICANGGGGPSGSDLLVRDSNGRLVCSDTDTSAVT